MYIDYKNMFSADCQDEIANRHAGNTFYGPAKVYAITQCESNTVQLNNLVMPREKGAALVVSLDCVIMFIAAICFIRLRWYERVSVSDMKKGKLRIEDFAVYIPKIPVKKEDYNNSPELLQAIVATHLEEVTRNELQQIPELVEFQENQTLVSSVHFGLKSHILMKHIIQIYQVCEKIADLKKKIQVDKVNSRKYEAKIWKHYKSITKYHDNYYTEK